MTNDLVTEIGYLSLNHVGEELCGDHVDIVHLEDGSSVMVLADGLGSGVKANILATLTGKLLATMTAENIALETCVKTVAATLPVCKDRGIAYSTFTIVKVRENKTVDIFNCDNPLPFVIRARKMLALSWVTTEIEGKAVAHAAFDAQPGDSVITFSDGVVHAGLGNRLDFGWERDQVIDYLTALQSPSYSAKAIATLLVSHCNDLYGGKPGDDTTAAVLKIRKRKHANLLIGPASEQSDDARMLSLFFAKEGTHIVSGGTTAHLVADYLHRELKMPLDYVDKTIPPISEIEGVDLVTEGVITINKVLEYAKEALGENRSYFGWCYKQDGASAISRMLIEEATDIDFFIGCAVNPAHQAEGVPIRFSLKMQLVDELSKTLKAMGKRVQCSYF